MKATNTHSRRSKNDNNHKPNVLIALFSMITIVLLVSLIFTWRTLSNERAKYAIAAYNHSLACRTIAAQKQTIVEYWHELHPTGTSVTLDRGTVQEKLANCP